MLLCDAGVLFGALHVRDAFHDRCAALLDEAEGIVAPSLALVEVDWLATSRRAYGATDALLRSVEDGTLQLVDLDLDDVRRARELMARYADLPLSLVDASIVVVAERLNVTTIGTLDRRDFSVIRPAHAPAFTLLP
jgi:predicted nucleic acid-binding protein